MRRLLMSIALLAGGVNLACAADIVIVSAAAVKVPLDAAQALAPAATGDRILSSFGTAGIVRDKITAGEPADIVVLPPARLDELVQQGLVAQQGRVGLGVVRLGVAVRSGTAKPALATEADIRATLLAAPSIGLADPASGATTGLYFAKLLKQMGLDETLKSHIRLFPDGTAAMEALARGRSPLRPDRSARSSRSPASTSSARCPTPCNCSRPTRPASWRGPRNRMPRAP